MDDPPYASEIRIGDLSLPVGSNIVYNYVLGDNWRFGVTLERVDPPNPRQSGAKTIERHGRSPAQYGA